MFDLMTSSGRARALKSVEPEVLDMLHSLVAQGGALARAVGRGGTPAWITAGGAVLAACALYWLIRPATADEPARKPAAKRAIATARRRVTRKRAATAKAKS